MPRAKLPAFDWDDANLAHIARHGVMPAEAERSSSALRCHSRQASAAVRIGTPSWAKQRRGLLLVVWTWRRRRIRVVTAFSAKRKWRALWKRIKGEHDA